MVPQLTTSYRLWKTIASKIYSLVVMLHGIREMHSSAFIWIPPCLNFISSCKSYLETMDDPKIDQEKKGLPTVKNTWVTWCISNRALIISDYFDWKQSIATIYISNLFRCVYCCVPSFSFKHLNAILEIALWKYCPLFYHLPTIYHTFCC